MKHEIFISHFVTTQQNTFTNNRLRLGLGMNEVAELHSVRVSVASSSTNQSGARVYLLADPDLAFSTTAIINPPVMTEEPGLLFGSYGNDDIMSCCPEGLVVPGDLLLRLEENINVLTNFLVMVYYKKKKSSNKEIAALMHKYGIHMDSKANLAETGATSPFSDV